MANYDVSFLNPKLRKSSSTDYGFLVDQLDVKQSQLEADGKLSPGDYDLLTGLAQDIYGHPGLSPSQRSNIEVKIASYKSRKSQVSIQDSSNISDLNNDVKDDQIKSTMLYSSKPDVLVKANIAVARAKLNRLTDSIDQAEASGNNASSYLIEYQNTLNDYNDLLDVQSKMKDHGDSQKPIAGYAAYVTTNTKGEVTDVKVAKTGDINGYSETNGLYGGLQVYGKPRKEGDKQVFRLGNQSFSAANVLVPDPQNPGSFKTNTLVSDSSKTGGSFTRAQAGVYTPVDLTTVRSQTSIPSGSYALGSKGFIYQAMPDGSYKKIVNATPESLGLHDSDFIRLPKDYEASIVVPRVSETTDFSKAPITPLPTAVGYSPTPTSDASTTTPAQQNKTAAQDAAPSLGNSRTPAPVSRTPTDAAGYAAKAESGGQGFFSKLFGAFKSNQ